jgi:hypothetical protein
MKKIIAIYDDMLDSSDQTFLEKIMTTKAKMSRKTHHSFAPAVLEKNILQGLIQTIDLMVPNSLKIDRDDKFYNLPYHTSSSITNILNSVDNYSDFFDSLDRYFEQMKRFRYDKYSDLPVVIGVKADKNYITLEYDRKLVKQNRV